MSYDWLNQYPIRPLLTKEEWNSFKSRLSVNTVVTSWDGPVFDIDEETGQEFGVFGGGRQGIFLTFSSLDRESLSFRYDDDEPLEINDFMIVQPFDFEDTCHFYDPRDLEYEIDGQWRTFDQIMESNS